MSDDPLVIALEDLASTAVRRGHIDVYRFCMAAVGLILTDAVTHRATAESVLDSCRAYIASARRAL